MVPTPHSIIANGGWDGTNISIVYCGNGNIAPNSSALPQWSEAGRRSLTSHRSLPSGIIFSLEDDYRLMHLVWGLRRQWPNFFRARKADTCMRVAEALLQVIGEKSGWARC